jgi:hypothetical protein
VELSHLFESNNSHLLLGATELLLAEPVRCTSFFDDGYLAQGRSLEHPLGRISRAHSTSPRGFWLSMNAKLAFTAGAGGSG